MRGPDAGEQIERALLASAATIGIAAMARSRRSTRWDSATFSGARHVMELDAPGGQMLARWLETLPTADLRLRGHILADLHITQAQAAAEERSMVRVEALTVAGTL